MCVIIDTVVRAIRKHSGAVRGMDRYWHWLFFERVWEMGIYHRVIIQQRYLKKQKEMNAHIVFFWDM